MWKVHKFGGTSLGTPQSCARVVEILATEDFDRRAVVVSAMSGVTDSLVELTLLAARRDDSYLTKADALMQRHISALRDLVPDSFSENIAPRFKTDFDVLKEVLRGIWHGRACSDRTVELVAGYGEIWSAQIVDAALRARLIETTWLDAREVLVVGSGVINVDIDWATSSSKLHEWLAARQQRTIVITGFIASTSNGIPTTLKRNGSDFSASIFGRLLQASEILIWTDVDGVLTADPRLVPEAVVMQQISYQEATELAYFGAKVVHPSTMSPAIEGKIPIFIRNTFNPQSPGTLIKEHSTGDMPVKGFSTIDGVALINVEGTGMIGVPGIAQRLFGGLREVGISVVMISQASSEHSICFAVKAAVAAEAKATVEKEFFAELHHGHIQRVDVNEGCSILAAVGDGMVEKPGVAGKFFGAIGRAGINIRAIAQGSSERNISVVIDQRDSKRALRAVHGSFYLSNQTLSLGVIGPGLIGGTFLDQLAREAERLRSEFRVDLRVRGMANSKAMLLSERKIDLLDWRRQLTDAQDLVDLDQFVDHLSTDHIPHTAIVDCTASVEIARHYSRWLRRGIHIITPNKKANTQSMAFYRDVKGAAREAERHYLYETTVGAGLPIITTLREFVKTGDRVCSIEGVLSGTLSLIFNSLDGSRKFSDIVQEARSRGFTEPDPRDDLSGMDVARKLVILAREMGLESELDDIEIESLVPAKLQCVDVTEFLARLPELDAPMAARVTAATERGDKLRYVGSIHAPAGAEPRLKVSVRSYPAMAAFSRIMSSDNLVAFHTDRYDKQPLIVQGPGAGPEVTAAGVFGDLLRLASYLGAHL